MDKWRKRQLIFLLGFYKFLYVLVKHVMDIQTLILQGKWEKFAILRLVYENMGDRKSSAWCQEQMYGFVDCLLLSSWTKNFFRKWIRIKYIIFKFLCRRLGPYLKKEVTHFRVIMLVEEKVAISLHRLGSSDGLQSIKDLYEVHNSVL